MTRSSTLIFLITEEGRFQISGIFCKKKKFMNGGKFKVKMKYILVCKLNQFSWFSWLGTLKEARF